MPAIPSVPFPFKGSDNSTYSGNTVPIDAGGAVPGSAADGAHVTIGAKADAAPANPAASGSMVAVLKGIWAALIARLPLDTNGNLKQVLYDSTGAAVSYGGTTPVQGIANGVAVAVDTVVRSTAVNRGGLTTARAASATVTAGGSGYAVNDTITNAAGIFTVNSVSAGAVTAVTATTPTTLTSTPTNPLSQTATSGGGTGATLTVTYAPVSVQVAAANASRRGFSIQNQSGFNLWLSGLATATADNNSLIIAPGGKDESSSFHVGTGIITVIGTAAGQPFYAREF